MDQDHELEGPARALSRRRVLGLFGTTAGLALVAGCGRSSGGATNAAAAAPLRPSARPAASAVLPSSAPAADPSPTSVPRGTTPWAPAGPYPADGPGDPNFLTLDGSVRRDIRAGLDPGTQTASGVPMTVRLTLLDYFNHGRPYNGAAIYLWHADRDGAYSMYGPDLTHETYLRGVQPAYADGVVEFTSIFPGVESGRWPHLHLEVYEDVQTAADAGTILRIAQIALPADVCRAVYASPGYATAAARFPQVGLSTDPVFKQGTDRRLATASGSVAKGYTVALTVEV
jgi:protocatechuate 3,4-dioxygenase beta subunit